MIAVLLGPAGVGTIAVFETALKLVGDAASLGISNSGVRQIAAAHGEAVPEKIALTVRTLRRACWVTGGIGWLACILLARPLSEWAFSNPANAGAFAILGFTLLLTSVNSGQAALIQGSRRIGDIARISLLSAFSALLISVLLFWWLGDRGIVPVLIVTAGIKILFSWHFARRIPVPDIRIPWRSSIQASGQIIRLGLAFALSGLLVTGVSFATRSLIVRMYGIDASGIYQAAFGISGVFAGFILAAMGADFYPRLTAVAADNEASNRIVNQQTEIGILLALPGLVGTISFAPFLMRALYSAAFDEGAVLLPVFVLGVFGRVLSWPLGYLLLAKNEARWFAITETLTCGIQLLLVVVLLRSYALLGTALAFALVYAIYTIMMLVVTWRLSAFKWTSGVWALMTATSVVITAAYLGQQINHPSGRLAIGAVLLAVSCSISLSGLTRRLGRQHRLVQMLARIPGISWLCKH